MSTASISYSSLRNASDEAKAVAKKYDRYADSLYNNVYEKLNRYDGEWSSNISTARSRTNQKISDLRAEQERYDSYADDLLDLRDACQSADQAVRLKVSSLTASFKEAHGIRNSQIENAVNYFLTGLGNGTSFGRWLNDRKDEFDAGRDYLKDSIKEWYNFEGGKELIQGVLVGILEVAIGILTIVGAVFSGGALLLIAGLIGGIIAVVNGAVNIANEIKGYEAVQNGDPAIGRRRSKIDSMQDYLRSSFIFGDDGERYEYNAFYNGLATGIDIVNLACTAVTFFSGVGKLLKNGFKWATGSAAKLKDISFRQIFSKEAFQSFRTKLGTQFKTGWAELKSGLKLHDWTPIKDFGKRLLFDAGDNLKASFWDFSDSKSAVSSIKNLLTVPKNLLSGGFNFSNIASVTISSVVVPAITVFHVSGDGSLEMGRGGQMQLNLFDNVTASDFKGIFDNFGKAGTLYNNISGADNIVSVDLIDHLSELSDVDISIPDVTIPDMKLSVLRAA